MAVASKKNKTRSYVSTTRAETTAENRQRVLASATRLLREAEVSSFSLDAVAKAASLSRLTVYNQFGSRRGLLEAVFDEVALRGGLSDIPDAMRIKSPGEALERIVEIFCAFWAGDDAIARLHDAMALDPEFATILTERNERRRRLLLALVRRSQPAASARQRKDTVDLLHACTSNHVSRSLRAGRSPAATCALVKRLCGEAVRCSSG